ncbi:MAG: ATP-binding protein [Chthoniobacterales bacterium]
MLLLYSNDRLLPANLRLDEGFRDTFGQVLGKRYELFTEFLDAIRFPEEARQDAMASSLRVRYRDDPPQVLVAAGAEALDFFQKRRNSLFQGTPLVFGGVRLRDKLTDGIGPDVAGVPMSLEIAPTLDLALRLRPQTLFEPFHSTKEHGLGMGLAICRMLVTAHGGRLWAEPNPGGGAAFLIALPESREDA